MNIVIKYYNENINNLIVLINSICKNNQGEINIYITDFNLGSSEKKRLNNHIKFENASINYLSFGKHTDFNEHLPMKMKDNNIEKCLIFDTQSIVINSLSDLYDLLINYQKIIITETKKEIGVNFAIENNSIKSVPQNIYDLSDKSKGNGKAKKNAVILNYKNGTKPWNNKNNIYKSYYNKLIKQFVTECDISNYQKALLIVNPKSGKMKIKNQLFEICEVFMHNGILVSLALTTKSGQGIEYAKNSKEFDLVLCSGGDGTLNEVVNGMMLGKIKKPLGYLPSGSTNDFANTLSIPASLSECAKVIANGKKYCFDIGLFNNKRYFNYIATFGVFSAVSYSTPQSTKNIIGHMAYILEGIKDITKIKPISVKIKVNGEEKENNYIFGAVCNSTSVAGIVKLDESLVNLNDGIFEIVLVKHPKSINDVNKIIIGITTSDFSSDAFEFYKASEIEFEFNKEVPWSLDGEYEQGNKKVSIKNIASAINIIND